MRTRALGLVVAAVLCAASCRHDLVQGVASAQRVTGYAVAPGQRVAVLTFAGAKGAVLSELLAIELLRAGVNVVDRDSLDRIVAEIKRTQEGMYDDSLSQEQIIQQLGKVVNADVIIYGESHAVDPYTIRLRDEKWMAPFRVGAILTFPIGLGAAAGGIAMLAMGATVPGAVLASIGGTALITGISMMAGAHPYTDFGDKSPVFYFADSSLSLRAFSTKTGEVVWWGSMETFVQAERGDEVTALDHLRVTARMAAMALTDPRVNEFARRAEDGEIREALWPALGR